MYRCEQDPLNRPAAPEGRCAPAARAVETGPELPALENASSLPALELLPMAFSVCKMADPLPELLSVPFCFFARTDSEVSLVCPSALVPEGTLKREDHWRAFRVKGVLDFSLIGILARISGTLADEKISVFVLSTFDTDYILVKEASRARAESALLAAGWHMETAETARSDSQSDFSGGN